MDYQVPLLSNLLEDKADWNIWKFKIKESLRKLPGGLEAIEGKFTEPSLPTSSATSEETAKYEEDLKNYTSVNSQALKLLKTNMTEEILYKVARFKTARDVWLELNRLFEGNAEDKVYELCSEFFAFKKNPEDNIVKHIFKLMNVWHRLKTEISSYSISKSEMPDAILTYKILDTLPQEYFSFKTSWLLMPKSYKTLENLTSKLCAREKVLQAKSLEDSRDVASSSRKERSGDRQNRKKIGDSCKQSSLDDYHSCGINSESDLQIDSTVEEVNDNERQTKITFLTETVIDEEDDYDSWFVDNGATNHVTHRKEFFKSFMIFTKNSHAVVTASGDSLDAEGKGSVEVEIPLDGRNMKITLEDVWYVPGIRKNLFSILAAQDQHPDSLFISKSEVCVLTIEPGVKLTARRNRCGGLFRLAMKTIIPGQESQGEVKPLYTNNITDQLQLYHERFGHQNKSHVKEIMLRELDIEVETEEELCEGCAYEKTYVKPSEEIYNATRPGELILADICGPFRNSISGFRYFILFKDGFSKCRFVYFIRFKSEILEKFKRMLDECEKAGFVVKCFLSDKRKEFDNICFNQILLKHGIKQMFSSFCQPNLKNSTNRESRVVVEMARAIMYSHGNFPNALWAEMINAACYILNLTAPTSVTGKSPCELWMGFTPGVKHLRVIGSTCYALLLSPEFANVEKAAIKGKLVGYDSVEGYRVWCEEDDRLVQSRFVIFHEEIITHTDLDETPCSSHSEGNQCLSDSRNVDTESENSDTSDDLVIAQPYLRSSKRYSKRFCNLFGKSRKLKDALVERTENENLGLVDATYLQNGYLNLSLEERLKIYLPEELEMSSSSTPKINKNAIPKEVEGQEDTHMIDKNMLQLPKAKNMHKNKSFHLSIESNDVIKKDHKKADCVYNKMLNSGKERKDEYIDQTFSPQSHLATLRKVLKMKESLTLPQLQNISALLLSNLEESLSSGSLKASTKSITF